MVGFLRKKKSDKVLLGDDTVLERKGKIDGASLLDDNGDPTNSSLYNANRVPLKKAGRKGSDEENRAPPMNGQAYPPANYPYGQTYPPHQQQQGAFSQGYGNQSSGGAFGGSFNNSRGSFGQSQPQQQYPVQYGHTQPQQYPVQYGHTQPQYGNQPQQYGSQPQYGNNQPQYGNQQQYPVQYGNYPPPQQPQTAKKSSFFRIPGYGKK